MTTLTLYFYNGQLFKLMMTKTIAAIAALTAMVTAQTVPAQQPSFTPGEVWKDNDGNTINAHGGGLLLHKDVYYWFGEIKKGVTARVPHVTTWEDYRVPAGGINCYSSKDLFHWKYEGVALAPNTTDSSHDLHTSKVMERPKVIYNKTTGQFVMWLHIDNETYSYARSGVAVSDRPGGPYRFIRSERPNGHEARDMTIFQDDDGKAYHIYSSEGNATMHIALLSDDYLSHTGIEKRIWVKGFREAPAVIKHNHKYYLFSSGCTGWAPNAASYAIASHMLGQWKQYGNPCTGDDAGVTFTSQGTYVVPVPGINDAYIFLADRWIKTDLQDSRYIWLPMTIRNGTPRIYWVNRWNFSIFNTH